MAATQLLIRRVEFSYEGRPRPLIFTHRALLMCEQDTGMDMLRTSLGSPPARLIRSLLYAALICAGEKCSIDRIGALITLKTLEPVRRTIIKAWAASMAEPEPEKPKDESGPSKERTWMDIWAEATSQYGLGLSDDEWLDMTPRQYRALQEVHLERMRREEILVGTIAATVENFSMGAPKTPSSPKDFMMHPFPPVPVNEQLFELVQKTGIAKEFYGKTF